MTPHVRWSQDPREIASRIASQHPIDAKTVADILARLTAYDYASDQITAALYAMHHGRPIGVGENGEMA